MANGILKRLGGMFTAEQTDTPPLLATDTQKEEKAVKAKKRNERLSVNPKTGQRFLIPPKIVPAFRPSSKLKDKFK